MRSHFAYCDQRLPHPPGASPFHIKGEFYRQLADTVAYHDEKSEGALARVLDREGLREFARQPFLSSALYDVLPLPRIVMAVAEARGRDVIELTGRMGQAAVEAQMKGVYSRFLTNLTPARFVQRFDQVINHFYDFAPLTAAAEGPHGARIVRKGMPLCIAEWWAVVTIPFVKVPLERSGAREVVVEWRAAPAGVQQGTAVGEVVCDVKWAAGVEAPA
jgi:hypothetical protein